MSPIQAIYTSMSCERFQVIRSNVGCENHDLLNHKLCKQVACIYIHSQHLSVDEQLRAFNGRYKYKVANPKKPAGIGVNAYILACGLSKIIMWYSIKGVGELGGSASRI